MSGHEYGSDPEEELNNPGRKGCCGCKVFKGRGGKLAHWLCYDMFFAAAAVCAVVWAFTTYGEHPNVQNGTADAIATLHPKVAQVVFCAKVIYGLSMVPFAMFMLPVLSKR